MNYTCSCSSVFFYCIWTFRCLLGRDIWNNWFFFRSFWKLEAPDIESSNLLSEFVTLIQSNPFFKLLKKFTDLDLANLDEDNSDDKDSCLQLTDSPSPCCYFNIRKWKHGCYTLLHDDNSYGREFALDAFIHFNCEGVKLLFCVSNLFRGRQLHIESQQ